MSTRRGTTALPAAILVALAGCAEPPPAPAHDAAPRTDRSAVLDAPDVVEGTDAPDVVEGTDAPDVVEGADAPDVADAGASCPPDEWILPGSEVYGSVGPASPRAPFACTRELAATRYYRLTVPPRRDLTLTLSARGAGAEHLRVQLLDSCAGPCLTGGDRSLVWRHEGPSERSLVAAVHGVGDPAFDVDYALRMALAPPSLDTSCAAARTVSLPARITVTAPTGSAIPRGTCDTREPIAWHRVVVPAGHVLVAAHTPRDDAALLAAEACEAGGGECTFGTLSGLRVPSRAVERAVVVGVRVTPSRTVTVDLDLLPDTPPGGAPRCEAPAPLAVPSNLDGPIFAAGEVPPDPASGGGRSARFYRVEIPPRSRITVESANDAAAVLPAECTNNRCNTFAFGPPRALSLENHGATPAPLTVAIVRTSLGVLAPVAVRVRAEALAPQFVCDTAPLIPPSGEVTLVSRTGDLRASTTIWCHPDRTIGGSHYYALDVPPRTVARVEAPNNWYIALIPRCGERTCMGATTYPFPPHSVRWHNEGDATARVIVVASDGSGQPPGTLRAEFVPYDPSMRCETGPILTDVPREATTRYGLDLGVCVSSREFPRPASWWRARVPPGRQVRIAVEGPPSTDLSILLSTSCGAFRCVGGYSFPFGARTEVVAINEGPGDVLHVQLRGEEATRRLSATLEDPPSNRRCASATSLMAGVELAAQRLAVSGDRAAGCDPIPWSTEAVYYRVEVPARARLRVSARAAVPITLRLYDACDASTCAAASPLTEAPELAWSNATDASTSRLVAVSTRYFPSRSELERFSLRAIVEPAPDGG